MSSRTAASKPTHSETSDGVTARSILLAVACSITLALIMLIGRAGSLDQEVAQALSLPRNATSLVTGIAYGCFALVSYMQLRAFSLKTSRIIDGVLIACGIVLSIAMGATGTDILGASTSAQTETLSSAGLSLQMCNMVLARIVYVWLMVLFALSLLRLPSLKLAAAAVIGATVLNQLLLYPTRYLMSLGIFRTVAVVLAVILMVGLTAVDRQALESISSKMPMRQLEVTNPVSSLWPSGVLYAAIFFVSLTYNFASATIGVPALGIQRMLVVLLVFALLTALLVRGTRQEDALFTLIVLFMMAGLLVAPMNIGDGTFVAHTLLWLGSTCFTVLLWMLVYGIGSRNATVMMPALGIIGCLNMLGRFSGGLLGSWASSLAASASVSVETVNLLLALAFFTLVWLGLRTFSFTQAIHGIEQVEIEMPPAPAPAAGVADGKGEPGADRADQGTQANPDSAFARRCTEIAKTAALTPRETEVFELLARGRNASYIMSTLNITRNTVKAHTAHIYAKIGVHSHQELLSLVQKE